ncbi:MAG: YitT family protein [Bacilli bacterium]|nr:YitT family protein [Bacilli bacterium]
MNRTAIKKQKTIKKIKEWIYITIGVALIAFSFSFFIEPKDLVIGGVSGIGVIIKVIKSGFNPALIILVINIILLLIGLILLGKDFFVKTAYGSLSYPLFIFIFEKIFTYFDYINF